MLYQRVYQGKVVWFILLVFLIGYFIVFVVLPRSYQYKLFPSLDHCIRQNRIIPPDNIAPTSRPQLSVISASNIDDLSKLEVLEEDAILYEFTFSPDSSLIGVSGTDYICNIISIFNLSTGNNVATFHTPSDESALSISSSAFDENSVQVLVGNARNTIHSWNIKTGEILRDLKLTNDEESIFTFSHDARWIASRTDRHIEIWDIEKYHLLSHLAGNTEAVVEVVFNPDKTLLATVDANATIRLWNTLSGKQIIAWERNDEANQHPITFSPDGNTLASAIGETIFLWDVQTGAEQAVFRSNSPFESIAFSPDNTLLAAADCIQKQDYTCIASEIWVWNVKTTEKIAVLHSDAHVIRIAFSPDNRAFASLEAHEGLWIWGVPE